MKIIGPLLLASLMTVACTTFSSADDRILQYGCDDIVLIGRLKNEDYEAAYIEDDLLGHGWATGRIKVRKVVKGKDIPSFVPIRYFAHTYVREDREFMFVLSRSDSNLFRVETAQLLSARPRLAAKCK